MKNEKRWLMEEKEPLCHRLDEAIANKKAELESYKKNSAGYKKVKKELDALIDLLNARAKAVLWMREHPEHAAHAEYVKEATSNE